MNIEQAIAQLTEAVNQNTAALKEILSVGSITAADTLVTPAPKKRAAKAPLAIVEEPVVEEPVVEEPVVEEPVVEEPVVEEPVVEEPVVEEPVVEEPVVEEIPDLPPAELLAKLKELIKGKLLADTEGRVKITFDALRQKYGVSVIKELTDDQVAPFYLEVTRWA